MGGGGGAKRGGGGGGGEAAKTAGREGIEDGWRQADFLLPVPPLQETLVLKG